MFHFAYRRSPDQDAPAPVRHPVVIIGAGPVGLTLALDLVRRGLRPVLIDDSDRIGEGSRAICFAKRTLEVFDRLGLAAPMLAKGVQWQRGRVFRGEGELYGFDLLPERGHAMPAFINLQQFYVEKILVDAAIERGIDLRWRNLLVGLDAGGTTDPVVLTIDTPDGPYRLQADWVVAADGARSPTRGLMGLDFAGEVFEDQFLIADVRMQAPFPTERWFWFDPPFHSGRSALLHKQPDDIWRIDLQLSADADAEVERQPSNVRPRIERMLGHSDFEIVWVSVYRFQCRRLEKFVHGRVVFAGDAAHQVSPFGARGANSGIQDADNLGWKLAAVLRGEAARALIDSYDRERIEAADENILNSTRATDFIAPRSASELRMRDAALALAASTGFAKRFVNSGRLSTPTSYSPRGPALPAAWGVAAPASGVRPGVPLPDAPLVTDDGRPVWLLQLLGQDFTAIVIGGSARRPVHPCVKVVRIGIDARDPEGLATERLTGGRPAVVLVRPDGHVASVLDVAADDMAMAHAVAAALDGRIGGPQPPAGTPAGDRRTISAGTNRFTDPDAAYRALIEAQRGLSPEASAAFLARLILVLANELGDQSLLDEAIAVAKASPR